MNVLYWAAAGMAVLAVGSWLAMVLNVRRSAGVWIAPWALLALFEEYGTLRDLGRVSGLWPGLLLLAAVGLLALALAAVVLG